MDSIGSLDFNRNVCTYVGLRLSAPAGFVLAQIDTGNPVPIIFRSILVHNLPYVPHCMPFLLNYFSREIPCSCATCVDLRRRVGYFSSGCRDTSFECNSAIHRNVEERDAIRGFQAILQNHNASVVT